MQKNAIAIIAAAACGLLALSFAQQPVVSWLTSGRAWSLTAAFDLLPGKWKIIVIGMAPITMLAIAILVKFVEMRRAQSWIGVPGKITGSRSVQRKVQRNLSSASDEDHEIRNFAEILYAYKVGGQTLQGSRLSVAADLGNSGVAERLARYKSGASVTVYYNPARPEDAVIERDMPAGSFKYGAWIVAGLTGVLFAAVFGVELLNDLVRQGLPNPRNAPIVTGLAVFAAILARFATIMRRDAAAVDGWGQTQGRVTGSETETFLAAATSVFRPQNKLLRQRVTYKYSVAGVDYSSDRLAFGGRTSSSVRMLEQSIVRRYPVGAAVAVFFDPANPSQAVLERGARLLWLVWASAGLLAAGALALSGIFG